MQVADLNQFELLSAQFRLEVGSPEDVINAASELIGQGFDSDALAEIAGLSVADVPQTDLNQLVDQALAAEGRPELDVWRARNIVARNVAEDIVGGRVTPYEGARFIWYIAADPTETSEFLLPFINFASEWEELPEQRDAIDADIVSESEKLIRL